MKSVLLFLIFSCLVTGYSQKEAWTQSWLGEEGDKVWTFSFNDEIFELTITSDEEKQYFSGAIEKLDMGKQIVYQIYTKKHGKTLFPFAKDNWKDQEISFPGYRVMLNFPKKPHKGTLFYFECCDSLTDYHMITMNKKESEQ